MKFVTALLITGLAPPPASARVGQAGQLYVKEADGTKRHLEAGCTKGNGYPFTKAVFTLNLLGKVLKDNASFNPKCRGSTCNMAIALSEKCTGPKNGRTCATTTNTKITLVNGGTDVNRNAFNVTDPDGTDGSAALMIPDPFADTSSPCYASGDQGSLECIEASQYHIFARVRGKGNMGIGLCFTDDTTADEYCMTKAAIGSSDKGNNKKATDISQALLTVCVDVDGDDVKDGVGLFDTFDITNADGVVIGNVDEGSYFWDLDNLGVRNAELRFFPRSELDEECFPEVTRGSAC